MVLVAHTPALSRHAQIRAQIKAEFSMVYTVHTLSMGTYWVWRTASADEGVALTSLSEEQRRARTS